MIRISIITGKRVKGVVREDANNIEKME